jgi:hypothetical protein
MDWMGVRSVKIGDVDDDGETEFVVTTAYIYDGIIRIYNGRTHLLERESSGYNGNYFSALAIGDVDNDGRTEIVAGQGREHTGAEGVYLIVFDGATATEEWRSVDLGTYWGNVYDIELADVDNDSNPEIIASIEAGQVYVYDGVTHQLDWLYGLSAYSLEVFDADADGQNEILIGKSDGVVDVYDGATFALESSYALVGEAILSLLVDDIDQNGDYEWLVSTTTKFSVFDGDTKDMLWKDSNLGDSIANFNHINSQDIDSDGKKEIVFGASYALYQFEVQNLPSPDIKANASDGPVDIARSDNLLITVELDAGDYLNKNVDWWILAKTSTGWYHYKVSGGWQRGISVTYQGALFDLSSHEVLNALGLPAASYTFYFGIDTDMNGTVDTNQLYYDSVLVNVLP